MPGVKGGFFSIGPVGSIGRGKKSKIGKFVAVAPPPPPVPVTIDRFIATDADDDSARRQLTTWWSNGGTGRRLGNSSVNYYAYGLGFRFIDINIPAGATIDEAYITVVSVGNYSVDTVRSDLCCENFNNPGQIVSYADHIGRARTVGAACPAWDGVPHFVTGSSYQSPSIVAAIQKVVDDQDGTGDALIVFWEDKDGESDVGAQREIAMHEQPTLDPVAIHIVYTPV